MTDAPEVPINAPAPPATPAEAQVRLDALKGNTEWSAKLLAGGAPETAEWQNLHQLIATGDDVDIAMSGALPEMPSSSLVEMSSVAGMLRDAGFTPQAIRETLSEQEVPRADVDRATIWKTQALRDPEFTARFLKGDPQAVKEMLAANVVLSLPIKKENAA